jgi:hypothetical protein
MCNKEEWEKYIWVNNNEAIEYLLDNNLIDINIQENNGLTPLIFATWNNKIEIIKLLLSYNDININYQTVGKNTALIWVSYNNRIEIVKLLLNHLDINIFLKDGNGKTVLHIAKKI